MLIKTEVTRRTESLNSYILHLKQRVCEKRYREACHFLKISRETVKNSYMAPYDPNTYVIDSLKTKN